MPAGLGGRDRTIEAIGIRADPCGRMEAAQRDAVVSAGHLRNRTPAVDAPIRANLGRIGGMKRARRARGMPPAEWPRTA
ncbi:hypothetical protein NDU88_004498 [Pleurodeles waltl]|uniref:Uncharacterized protein n=1 Tax=Pleurodeles waltl TaxID=8319 RepID=A0AAV7MXN8_PLEWA|nr:hypothetical protein NDU88_004498 [Pleurodeles waltl]